MVKWIYSHLVGFYLSKVYLPPKKRLYGNLEGLEKILKRQAEGKKHVISLLSEPTLKELAYNLVCKSLINERIFEKHIFSIPTYGFLWEGILCKYYLVRTDRVPPPVYHNPPPLDPDAIVVQ